jgi:NAD+ synthase (glutamine-hydrolysing)
VVGEWFVHHFYSCRPFETPLLIDAFSTIDGNYREYRHFTPWQRPQETEDYYLEQIAGKITGQYKVPFGDAVISTRDTCLGLETCEELFTPNGCVDFYPSPAWTLCTKVF